LPSGSAKVFSSIRLAPSEISLSTSLSSISVVHGEVKLR
jgi:hypothetical protein